MKQSICAGGFLMKKDRFLLGKRSKSKSWAPGMWDIVGGHALKREHPLYTLRRESLEEIDITVLNAEPLTIMEVPDLSKSGSFIYHIYWITDYKGKPVNSSEEHTKIRWFTREELNEVPLAMPEYLQMIDDWLYKQSVQKQYTCD